MPLPLLLVLVTAGIGGLVLLLHLLGLSHPLTLTDQTEARALWRDSYPESHVTGVVLCQSGAAALIDTADGPGILWPMGADAAARPLTGARAKVRGGALDIYLPDYTAPHIRLTLTPDEARDWAARIGDAT